MRVGWANPRRILASSAEFWYCEARLQQETRNASLRGGASLYVLQLLQDPSVIARHAGYGSGPERPRLVHRRTR